MRHKGWCWTRSNIAALLLLASFIGTPLLNSPRAATTSSNGDSNIPSPSASSPLPPDTSTVIPPPDARTKKDPRLGNRGAEIHRVETQVTNESIRVLIHRTPVGGFIQTHHYHPPRLTLAFPAYRNRVSDTDRMVDRGNLARIRVRERELAATCLSRVVLEMRDWSDSYTIQSPDSGPLMIEFPNDSSIPRTSSNRMRSKSDSWIDTPTREGIRLRALGGAGRRLSVDEPGPVPLAVLLQDTAGQGLSREPVQYSLLQGTGRLLEDRSDSGNRVRVRTNRYGVARARFHADTVAGTVIVGVRVPAREISISFELNVQPGPPDHLVKVSGQDQRTRHGESIHRPLIVAVHDTHGNPVPDVPLRVEVPSGRGVVDTDREQPGRQSLLRTDARGRAQLEYYRLPEEGNGNEVRMSVVGSSDPELSTQFRVVGEPRLVSVDFQEANLQDVLVALADLAGWDLSVSNRATADSGAGQRTVTLRMRDVPPLKVLDAVLNHHDLARFHNGSVLRVVPASNGVRRGGDVLSPEELDQFKGRRVATVSFRLQSLEASDELAKKLTGTLLGESAGVVADPATNSLIVTDQVDRLNQLREVLQRVDAPGRSQELRVYELQRRGAAAVSRTLEQLLPSRTANVVAHTGSQHLIVYGNSQYRRRAEELVDQLDRRNAILEHLEVIDVAGYDAAKLAERLNSVLGLRLLSLDRLESVRFDGVESAREFFTRREELDPGSLLRSARIVPLPDLRKIIVLAPGDVRETARALVERIKRTPSRYITDRYWSWVGAGSLPLESARDLVERFGGVNVELVHESWNRLLVSSDGKGSSRKIENFLEDLRSGPGLVTGLYAFERVDLTETLLEQVRGVVERRNLNVQLSGLLSANTVLYTTPPGREDLLRGLLEKVERAGSTTQVVALDHRNARDLSRTLNLIFGSGDSSSGRPASSGPKKSENSTLPVNRGSGGTGNPQFDGVNIGYDNATNSIFFTAPPAVANRVRRTIDRLDRWQKQVLIRARLVEIRLAEGMEFRPEYIAEPNGNPLSVGGDFNLENSEDAGAGFNIGGNSQFTALLTASEFTAALRWLRDSDRSRVLTRPVVSALNNSTAKLDLSEQRFFQVVERDDEGNPIATTFRPQSASKVLNVTPTITSDSNVIMDVLISNDVFGARPDQTTPFPVSTRETRNSILVKHGQTLVIGGIIQSNETRQVSGIPGLMDLPWVGSMFRETVTNTVRTELVAFLTPRIMRTPTDLETETASFSGETEYLRTPTVLPASSREDTSARSELLP